MTDTKAQLLLRTAPEEDAISTKSTQAELVAAYGAARVAGIPVSARHMTFDSVGGGGGLTGEFVIPLVQFLGSTAVSSIVVAWLQGRAGRKARLKIGDVEAEARSADEIERLLEAAQRFQDKATIGEGDAP